VEKFLKSGVVAKLQHSRQEPKKVVDEHHLVGKLEEFKRPCDDEDVQLLAHDLQKAGDRQ